MQELFENFRSFLKENKEVEDLVGYRILLIGDSQMLGGPKAKAWGRNHMGRFLEELLAARGAKVMKQAKGGWGSKSWSRKLNNKRFFNNLKNFNPILIVVNLGQNDSGRDENYYKKYTVPLMQSLKQINKNIIWFGPTHISTRNKNKRAAFKAVDEQLKTRANALGIKYITMLNWMDNDKDLLGRDIESYRYDAAHFSKEPAKKWAQSISSKILPDTPEQNIDSEDPYGDFEDDF